MKLADGAEEALESFRDDTTDQVVHPLGRYRRWPRGLFPLLMFLATILSTVWVGMLGWVPDLLFYAIGNGSAHILRRFILANWWNGIEFSASLLLILLAHEFGHYLMMKKYGIHSTFPIFIPFPVSPLGTCGALILMDPSSANRRQIFDIGIAGPLAGLMVAVPMAILGLLYPSGPPLPAHDSVRFGIPWVISLIDQGIGTKVLSNVSGMEVGSFSPMLMAAWIGFLVTGLNMIPISQLDGGHVSFGIFGARSESIAKAVFVAIIAYMIATQMFMFSLMLLLVLLMGLKHPPSSDDSQEIGTPRVILGLASLCIPILCIPATPFYL
jgi:Zn-dependent protease